MSTARTLHVVVPEGIADPLRPSGGNTYDRRVCQELGAAGWTVHTHEVPGGWPVADLRSRGALADALGDLPAGSVVLVDGLVASAAPEVMVPAGRRLRTVVLMHMPIGAGVSVAADVGAGAGGRGAREREGAVLRAAATVVTTSAWTRRWLLSAYGLEPARIHVARPGVDVARAATGTADGGSLLCVGAVTPGKGHDLLVAALARVADRPWTCVCVGPLTRSPDFVATLRRDIRVAGLDDRVVLAGPRTGADLDAAYAAADLLVLASRAETYGMVVTEALARGLPGVACDVGGVSEALGATPDGSRPGVLVPPGDVDGLAGALRRWLDDAGLRRRLRDAARERRTALPGWEQTAGRVARVLEGVAA